MKEGRIVLYLGIDIGGTETNYGLIDDQGELGDIKTIKTPMESLTQFLDMMGDIYDEYANQIEEWLLVCLELFNPKLVMQFMVDR